MDSRTLTHPTAPCWTWPRGPRAAHCRLPAPGCRQPREALLPKAWKPRNCHSQEAKRAVSLPTAGCQAQPLLEQLTCCSWQASVSLDDSPPRFILRQENFRTKPGAQSKMLPPHHSVPVCVSKVQGSPPGPCAPPSPMATGHGGSCGQPGASDYPNRLIHRRAIYINHAVRSFLKYFLHQIRRITLQLRG